MVVVKIIIAPTDDIIRRYGNQIGALGEERAYAALARAVNRTVDQTKTQVIRSLVAQTSAPRSVVVSQLSTRKVDPLARSGGALEGAIVATGSELPLKVFKPKQFAFGVRAKVWGRVQRFPHQFIYAGTFRSGNPVAHGHVFVRTGASSLPIELTYGPSIPVEMVKDQTAETFQAMAAPILMRRVEHELSRLLPR